MGKTELSIVFESCFNFAFTVFENDVYTGVYNLKNNIYLYKNRELYSQLQLDYEKLGTPVKIIIQRRNNKWK